MQQAAVQQGVKSALTMLGLLLLLGGQSKAAEKAALLGFSAQIQSEGGQGLSLADASQLFSWPEAGQLSVVIELEARGYEGERSLDLFTVLFEERPGVETKYQQPLVKLKGNHRIGSGKQRFAFPEIWHCAEHAGLRNYRLELEASLKGASSIKDVLRFSVDGPPLPEVEVISLDGWNPASSRNLSQWQPGDSAQFNLLFELRGNQARRGPNLVIFAVMEDDRYLMSLEENPALWQAALNWDVRNLPPEDGVYQCVFQARIPTHFADPWNTQHSFSLHAAIDYGAGQAVSSRLNGLIVDYTPGEHRREPEPEQRLIDLDPAQRWDIRRIRPGV